jgi:putative membrane protein
MISARSECRAASPARYGLVAGATIMSLSAIGSTAVAAQQSSPYYYGPHMWDGGWSMFLGPFSGLLFLGVLIALVVLLVRWLSGGSMAGAGPSSMKAPLDILRERFARGEIDKDEFEERKRILGA